jgi:hypothetical protein
MSEFQSVNEGTSNKGKLQDMALRCITTYPQNQTLKAYAELLSWDLKVSFRTALDSYILPMLRKGYLIHVRSDTYTQTQNNQLQTKVWTTCKNCDKPTPANTTFCSKDCLENYRIKREGNIDADQ